MASSLNLSTDVALVDTRTTAGSIQLPFTSTIPYRVFTIKDAYGSFGINALTVTTQGSETFEDGSTSKVFSDNFSHITLYGNTQDGVWQIIGATQYSQITVSSIVGISTIQGGYFIGDGSRLSNTGTGISSLSSIVAFGLSSLLSNITVNLSTLSTSYGQIFNTSTLSTINIAAQIGFISTLSTTNLTVNATTNTNIINANSFSTGTFVTNIISTNAIFTSSIMIGASDSILDITGPARATTFSTFYIDTSTINATTAVIPTAFVSTLVSQLVSTPVVNVSSIQMGSFGSIIDVTGPLRFTTGSTINFYASSIMANGLQLGSTSNTSIFFDGVASTYDRTTISETTITGTNQELLLFKGNTTTDQIRAQTTGNIILEAGVSSRVWPTATQGANPSLYMLGTSAPGQTQVGINTIPTLASGITLDVASQQTGGGLIRAPVVSTTQLFASTISATLFPVYYNTIISTVNTGQTMFLPATTSGSYVFITSSNVSTSNVSVSLPITSVPRGSLFVIKHKGQTGGVNSVNILNTSSSLSASTSMTAVYSGIEWLGLGVSAVG